MRRYIKIYLALIFIFNSAFANDEYRKEKKALIETIKKEYVISVARDYQEWLIANFSNSEKIDSMIKPMESDLKLNAGINNVPLDNKPDPIEPANRFKDFKFNIVNDQAVVQFKVDQQTKSAFLEKINGQWKLISAADLNSVL